MATIKDVSRMAGVSIATVSRVLNNSAPVNEETRERVYRAMETLGYTPNVFAQGLVTRRSNTVGLILPDLRGAFFSPLITSLEKRLRTKGLGLTVSVGNQMRKDIFQAVERMRASRCDAIILSPHCLGDDDLFELFDKFPQLILINRYLPEKQERCIVVDNPAGGRLATLHLIGRGHERIACITGPMVNVEARQRLEGYQSAMRMKGLPVKPEWVVEGAFDQDSGYECARALLARAPEVTAIFACNDQMAVGALRALRDAGHEVPAQMSLVGFDDEDFTELLNPPLTTIHQPVWEMGETAADLVMQDLGLRREPVSMTLFSPSLIDRESVAAPR